MNVHAERGAAEHVCDGDAGGDELGVLTIEITAGGAATWTFNPSPDSSGNPSFSFTATVTDADGDVDADTHTISITEGAPPTSSGHAGAGC